LRRAEAMVLARSDVLWAQNQLFNRLCSVYVRTRDISFIGAEELKKNSPSPIISLLKHCGLSEWAIS
jgi:hypothetical protein